MKKTFLAIGIIFKITLTIVLFITLPLVVFTLITSKMPVMGIKSFVVLTGSMSPNIPAGSIIYTQARPSYGVGDVIAFKQGNVNVTHRIIEVTPEGFRTRGDANNVIDSKIVPQSDVLGSKVMAFWNIGKVILALKTVPGFLAFIVLPALIIIGFEFWNIKKEWEKSIKKKLMKQLNLEKDLAMFKNMGERMQNNRYSL